MALVVAGDHPAAAAPPSVSFSNDVMAVLSKAGCNQGTCHGNQQGKGGFKLSLRGQEPTADWIALTRQAGGRQVDPLAVENSLLLTKPSLELAHGGGRRFDRDSREYQILHAWLAEGLPADPPEAPRLSDLAATPATQVIWSPAESDPAVTAVQLAVTARFSDGTSRDVTALAVYEPSHPRVQVSPLGLAQRTEFGEAVILVRYLDRQVPVRLTFLPERSSPAGPGPQQRTLVDVPVFARLAELRLAPTALSSDTTFLRRLYLDLLGLLPTVAEAQEFIASADPQKRAALIERLLVREEFATHWALKWADLLKCEEKVVDFKGVQNSQQWLRKAFADNLPLDELARRILAARGSTYQNPAANFWRAHREPAERAEAVAQVFLGVRLQCAKCHHHPFDRWTQDDYYGFNSLVSGIEYKILENLRRDENDSHEFDGEQVVWEKTGTRVKNPRTGEPAPSRLLGGGLLSAEQEQDRLATLAAWATSAENPFFARTQANRIWFQVVGRGVVEPLDDFRDSNPASNPQLLEALTAELIRLKFDLRAFLRVVLNSHTYQAAAAPDRDELAAQNFAHAQIRRLSAEQLLDALAQVTAVPADLRGFPRGMRAGELPGALGQSGAVGKRGGRRPTPAERFLSMFGKPPRLLSCECERSQEPTLGQTFELVGGPVMQAMLAAPDNRLGRLLGSGASDDAILEELFWATLSRPPQDEERRAVFAHLQVVRTEKTAADGDNGTPVGATAALQDTQARRQAWEDVLWGLCNSIQCLFRH